MKKYIILPLVLLLLIITINYNIHKSYSTELPLKYYLSLKVLRPTIGFDLKYCFSVTEYERPYFGLAGVEITKVDPNSNSDKQILEKKEITKIFPEFINYYTQIAFKEGFVDLWGGDDQPAKITDNFSEICDKLIKGKESLYLIEAKWEISEQDYQTCQETLETYFNQNETDINSIDNPYFYNVYNIKNLSKIRKNDKFPINTSQLLGNNSTIFAIQVAASLLQKIWNDYTIPEFLSSQIEDWDKIKYYKKSKFDPKSDAAKVTNFFNEIKKYVNLRIICPALLFKKIEEFNEYHDFVNITYDINTSHKIINLSKNERTKTMFFECPDDIDSSNTGHKRFTIAEVYHERLKREYIDFEDYSSLTKEIVDQYNKDMEAFFTSKESASRYEHLIYEDIYNLEPAKLEYIKDMRYFYSWNQVKESLTPFPDDVRNIVIHLHGSPIVAHVSNNQLKANLFGYGSKFIDLPDDVQVYFVSCYQGRYIKDWAKKFGLPEANVHGFTTEASSGVIICKALIKAESSNLIPKFNEIKDAEER